MFSKILVVLVTFSFFTQFSQCIDNSTSAFLSQQSENSESKIKISHAEIIFGVLGLFLFLIFLIFCYLISYCLNHQEVDKSNSVIFSIPWTLLNLVLNILFTFNNGEDVPSLYLPSMIFLIGPILVNIVLSFGIITNELRSSNTDETENFGYWFRNTRHTSSLAATASVLAGADISTLKLISSKLFNMKMFKARFSRRANKLILWGCIISFFISDLPQFTIQIMYKTNKGEVYSLIPFLKLITISMKLLIGVIGNIYEALSLYLASEE